MVYVPLRKKQHKDCHPSIVAGIGNNGEKTGHIKYFLKPTIP